MEDSKHFRDMLRERGIDRAWVERTVAEPERSETHEDGTRHYLRRISEREDRWLRVVVNVRRQPALRVTAFFDRRMRRRR
jgi:hypothetical protein